MVQWYRTPGEPGTENVHHYSVRLRTVMGEKSERSVSQ